MGVSVWYEREGEDIEKVKKESSCLNSRKSKSRQQAEKEEEAGKRQERQRRKRRHSAASFLRWLRGRKREKSDKEAKEDERIRPQNRAQEQGNAGKHVPEPRFDPDSLIVLFASGTLPPGPSLVLHR